MESAGDLLSNEDTNLSRLTSVVRTGQDKDIKGAVIHHTRTLCGCADDPGSGSEQGGLDGMHFMRIR